MTTRIKRQVLRDLTDVSLLPEGQMRAVVALVGGDKARTYIEAAKIAGTSVNTLYTHLRRIRSNHPKLYEAVYKERKAQLRIRHREAAARAREHTKQYFRRVRKSERWLLWKLVQ